MIGLTFLPSLCIVICKFLREFRKFSKAMTVPQSVGVFSAERFDDNRRGPDEDISIYN
jgi:hypothetical protein